MSPERFEHLVTVVGPLLTKKSCQSRQPISAEERLIITLRFLGTGDSQQSQSVLFRIGQATVSHIIRETCAAIWTALMYRAPVAQLIEHRVIMWEVVSSTPAGPTLLRVRMFLVVGSL